MGRIVSTSWDFSGTRPARQPRLKSRMTAHGRHHSALLQQRTHQAAAVSFPQYPLRERDGSKAYLVSDDDSDMDLYGFCMPPKSILFPHLAGYIPGFDTQVPKFESFQAHDILDLEAGKIYDLNIFSIVTYFRLCADCNPNMIDSLFTKPQFLLTLSPIGRMVLENRQMFLYQKV